jgi:hypothetical protein
MQSVPITTKALSSNTAARAVVRDFFVFKSLKKPARKGTKSPPGREQKARPEGNKKPARKGTIVQKRMTI